MTSFRLLTDSDRAFVTSGWSSSYRESRDSTIPMPLWADIYHRVVAWYLDNPRNTTQLSIGSDWDARRGFICYEGNFVHYCYVAGPYRGHGIARSLFAAAGIDPTSRFEYGHRTRTSYNLRGKFPAAKYNPYRGRFPEEKAA